MRPAQRADLALLCAWGFSSVSALFIARTVRDTLFLAHESAARLPLLYILSPLTATLVGLAYGRLAARVERRLLVPATAVTIAALVLVFRFSLGPRWIYYALYVAMDCSGMLLTMNFWIAVGERFSAREAKRVLGFVAAGGTAANIVVGLLMTTVAPLVRTEDLLFGSAAFILAIAALSSTLAGRPIHGGGASRGGAATSERAGSSHLSLLVPLLILTMLAITTFDFQFKSIVTAAYGSDRVGMVRYFSLFYVAAGAASLVIQLGLTARILARAGVAGALLLLPLAMAAGGVGLLLAPSLIAATACKAADATLRFTINDAGVQLLYLPVPLPVRARWKARIDAAIKPATEASAGVGLLVYRSLVAAREPLILVGIAITLVWLVVVVRMRTAYARSLRETLRRRRLAFDADMPEFTQDAEDAVRSALAGDDAALLRHGLDLARADASRFADELRALLFHDDCTVRAEALECLALGGEELDDAALSRALADPEPAVRAAAARVAGPRQLASVEPLLAEPDPLLAAAAGATLYRRGSADRRAVVVDRVRSLLSDPRPLARRRGIEVSRELADAELVAPLVACMGDAHAARPAALALLAIGEAAEQALLAAAGDADDTRACAALAALGHVESQAALSRLVEALADPRALRRAAAARALARARREWPDRAPPREPLVKACLDELKRAFTDMAAADGLGRAESAMLPNGTFPPVPYAPDSDEGPAALISRALRERSEAARERLLDLLAALAPELDLPTVRANLRDPDPTRRANAVEALDATPWPPPAAELKPLVLALIDDVGRERKLAAVRRRLQLPHHEKDGWVDALLADPDAWIRACAAYFAGATADLGARPRLLELESDRSPLVRETARQAGRRIDAPGERADMLSTAEKVLFLKGADLFSAIPGEDLAAIAALAHELTSDEGTTIFVAGDPGDSLYLVVEGSVRIEASGRRLAELGTREVFGEMALLDPAPRSASATAVTPVVLLRLDQDDFADILAERPEVAAGILRVLTRRLRAANLGEPQRG